MTRTSDFEVTLSEEQVAFFRENGFLSIERITTDEEVAWLRGIYDRLFTERMGEEKGEYFDLGGPRAHAGREVLPQVLGPERKFPELRETLYYRNARRCAAQLLGAEESEVTGGGHMILKPAGYGRETPWHQDEAYWDPNSSYRSLSIWLPLDPATIESGCMQFIPGSHRSAIRKHRHIDNDPTVHGLVTDDVDPSLAVACPIPVGGATFHHCRTLHYAGPNTTVQPRRAYILVLSSRIERRDTPDSRPWQEEARAALAKLPSLARPSTGKGEGTG
jgi:ectoine hydroxylase-related dioxygenase (phytanoyl-CoA dioxygenase family)